jgi:hypothetical protein
VNIKFLENNLYRLQLSPEPVIWYTNAQQLSFMPSFRQKLGLRQIWSGYRYLPYAHIYNQRCLEIMSLQPAHNLYFLQNSVGVMISTGMWWVGHAAFTWDTTYYSQIYSLDNFRKSIHLKDLKTDSQYRWNKFWRNRLWIYKPDWNSSG